MAIMNDSSIQLKPCGRLAEEGRRSLEAAMAGMTGVFRYVANRNIEMDAVLTARLVALRDSYVAGHWQSEDEQEFWPAYHKLVAGIGVPMDGVILSHRWTRSIAWAAAIFSLAALTLLVFQLSFWAGLDSTIHQIDDIEGQIAEAVMPTAATESEGRAQPMPKHVAAQRCIQLMALYRLLSERFAGERSFLLSASRPETLTMPDTGETCLQRASLSEATRAYLIGSARLLRTAHQDYVLPVLFGLLGTIAFLLRSLAQELRDARLTVTDIVGAAVRVPLGMLAGLAIGWVQLSPQDTAFTQITPWALAFIAGYSVELLFAAMDRLIGAFAGEPQAQANGR
jgi:hypothetical protein